MGAARDGDNVKVPYLALGFRADFLAPKEKLTICAHCKCRYSFIFLPGSRIHCVFSQVTILSSLTVRINVRERAYNRGVGSPGPTCTPTSSPQQASNQSHQNRITRNRTCLATERKISTSNLQGYFPRRTSFGLSRIVRTQYLVNICKSNAALLITLP